MSAASGTTYDPAAVARAAARDAARAITPATTSAALYGAPIPGNEQPTRLWDVYPGAAVVEVEVPLPRRDDCPRCRRIMAEGGALAAILADDGYCLAPWTHALGLLPE